MVLGGVRGGGGGGGSRGWEVVQYTTGVRYGAKMVACLALSPCEPLPCDYNPALTFHLLTPTVVIVIEVYMIYVPNSKEWHLEYDMILLLCGMGVGWRGGRFLAG